jgi:hypothetical protein
LGGDRDGFRHCQFGVQATAQKVFAKVIHSEEENDAYTRALYELDQRSAKLTRAEKERAELLTLLIADFESKR